eukprot:9158603-Pyramimonas_sp.AAC.1
MAIATDPAMQAVLNAQVQRLGVSEAVAVQDSEVEAMRKADGAWRAATNHHNQVVSNVIRLRKALEAAENKEQAAALE